ncbi:MAG: DUF1836 domain-containing protein [Lachnospiraceae bacterium]|nr:DUF1836 domain-containing protein [Lachnospiraceae bacterium]
MEREWRKYLRELLDSVQNPDYIRPQDIPNIDLYMDQVTTFMDEHLETTKRFEDDKLLTKTMINNYTKNNLLPNPNKKKYSREHMYLLVFIYYLKNFLSISDVKRIVEPMQQLFYGSDSDITLGEIYHRIVETEKDVAQDLGKDVMNKFLVSRGAFDDVKDPDEREFLNIFSFIAMLSFDVYLKKAMIEKIIDELLVPAQEERKTSKKETSKKSKEPNE